MVRWSDGLCAAGPQARGQGAKVGVLRVVVTCDLLVLREVGRNVEALWLTPLVVMARVIVRGRQHERVKAIKESEHRHCSCVVADYEFNPTEEAFGAVGIRYESMSCKTCYTLVRER